MLRHSRSLRHLKLELAAGFTWCQRRWLKAFLQRYQRFNAVNIQMLSDTLHQQLFKHENSAQEKVLAETSPAALSANHTCKTKQPNSSDKAEQDFKRISSHLEKFGLLKGNSSAIPDIHLELPKLHGSNVDGHFRHIATEQTKEYRSMAERIANAVPPPLPEEWARMKGWTKYGRGGQQESVPYPDADALLFDIEMLVKEGNFPTMATALSPTHWYSWTSDYVLQDRVHLNKEPQLSDLIPLETEKTATIPINTASKRLIIGHNVGFDRSFVKEQYFIQGTQTRFMDTMSMHIAICGLTSFQRILFQSSAKQSSRKEVREHTERQKMFNMASSEEWKKISSMNNLSAVHQLHCGGPPLDKESRDVFVEGNMTDVRENFQELMTYCANDVLATHAVFAKLWPEFLERFPHPVTLAGMLEMGTAYLPIDSRWPRYIDQANAIYEDCQKELRQMLISLANDACLLMEHEAYMDDIWLWDLDWKLGNFKMKKNDTPTAKTKIEPGLKVEAKEEDLNFSSFSDTEDQQKERNGVDSVYAMVDMLPKNPVFMAGYPAWYHDLCPRPSEENWYPEPSNISTQCRVTPKLMRLTWNGFPLHFDSTFGWGFLVPTLETQTELERELEMQDPEETQTRFPVRAFLEFMKTTKPDMFVQKESNMDPSQILGADFDQKAMDPQEAILHWDAAKAQNNGNGNGKKSDHLGDGPHDIGLPGCLFYTMPHKDGSKKRVGNPLAKDYLHRVEDGTLRAEIGDHATRALTLSKLCSYWKNNKERIEGQVQVWLKKGELPKYIAQQPDYVEHGMYGAIIPRIVVAGTITRRAVEPTWLTASNAYPDRIGSELKAMIHTPPGYHFVGADVDSQELWIAAILGDAHFMKIHGCTALGWMTLQGNKADKTDLHSKTAELAKVSRDNAKVLNYGRIYGAGQAFAEQLLMQFNPSITPHEARTTAREMFRKTKGLRNKEGVWTGGSESFMFNALEKIANSEWPTTPVLGCRISRALEPKFVLDDFLTSRVNWVVQSSAVDYLHLMLVSMRWLIDMFGLQARFCISIHDEVRYLVTSPDRNQAALALHITNLLTRAMFAERLGMIDLPQSVAFFSAVDLDKCLRKEVTMDCKTPSNPHGLAKGYDIPQGEALDIFEVIKRTGGKLQK